jgi:hypothetical protein
MKQALVIGINGSQDRPDYDLPGGVERHRLSLGDREVVFDVHESMTKAEVQSVIDYIYVMALNNGVS